MAMAACGARVHIYVALERIETNKQQNIYSYPMCTSNQPIISLYPSLCISEACQYCGRYKYGHLF